MELIEDGMDCDVLGVPIELRAVKAAAFLAAATAAASGGGGRDVHRRPSMPLAVPSSKSRMDMPPPSPHSSNTVAMSPHTGRMQYDQMNGGGMGLSSDRGVNLPFELMALQQALLQTGGLNGQQQHAMMLRLLMQTQAVAGSNGILTSGGLTQSNSHNGGSGGGSDRASASGVQGSVSGLPSAGGQQNGRIAPGSASKGVGGTVNGLYADGALQGPRGNSPGSHAETFSTQPPTRSGGSGITGSASSGAMTINTDLLKALLATNGSLNGLNLGLGPSSFAAGPMSELLDLSGPQLNSVLQQMGVGIPNGSGLGATVNGVLNSSSLLNGLKGTVANGDGVMGASAAGAPLPIQHLVAQLAALGGMDTGALAAVLGATAAPSSNSSNILELLSALPKAELSAGMKGGSAATASSLVPLAPKLAAVLQHQGLLPEGLLKSSALNSLLASASGLGGLASLGGGSGSMQLSHLLSLALGGGNGRLAVGRMEGLDDSDLPAAAAAAVVAAGASPRETDLNGDTRGGSTTATAGSGRGSGGRPQRHSSSELGSAGGSGGGGGGIGGGNSKGPTGLQLLKSLVTSGAAGAGVAGLMNGSGGLADLSVLPGGVATQLMEDLESLGYRAGISQRVSGGGVSSAASNGNRSADGGARAGSAAPSNGVKSRFVPPGSPGVKKPNKRPENGSLATQILNRQRHAIAMQQATGSDPGNGPSIGLPAVSPQTQSSSLLAAAADQAMLLGPGGSGLGGLVSAGTAPGLAAVLGSIPPAAASGLPQVAPSAALLATQPASSSINTAALANAVTSARSSGAAAAAGGLLSGLSIFGGGGGDAVLGTLATGGLGNNGVPVGTSNGVAAAQLRALTLARPAPAAALLVASALRKTYGLGASLLFAQPVPKGRRSRRTARPSGPVKLRNIMKDLGIQSLKRNYGDTLQSEQRDTRRSEPTQVSSRDGSGSSGGSSDAAANDTSTAGPPPRRQRVAGTASTAGPMTAAISPAAAFAETQATPRLTAPMGVAVAAAAASQAGCGGDSQAAANSSAMDSTGGSFNAAKASNAAAVAALPWDLIVRSTAAGVPLAAVVARALGLQSSEGIATMDNGNAGAGNSGTPAILSAALAARAAAAAAAAAAGAGTLVAPLVTTQPSGAVDGPARTAKSNPGAASEGCIATSGPQVTGPGGKPAQASKSTAAAGTAAASTTAPTGSGTTTAAAKSRRKGGAPSRAAD